MMIAVFATMGLAFVFGYLRYERTAVICLFASFGLAVGLFLWEIYSPEYGFRMPWIQTELDSAPAAALPRA